MKPPACLHVVDFGEAFAKSSLFRRIIRRLEANLVTLLKRLLIFSVGFFASSLEAFRFTTHCWISISLSIVIGTIFE